MSGAIPLQLLYILMSWAGTASERDPSKGDCYLTPHILILEIKVVFNMHAYFIYTYKGRFVLVETMKAYGEWKYRSTHS
jgi:hypothetical protein